MRYRAWPLAAIFVLLCALVVAPRTGAATVSGEDDASAAGVRVQVVQIGTTSINGETSPLWAIQIGDTQRAEELSEYFSHSRFLGPNCTNAVIWVRPDDDPGWLRVDYQRPQGPDDFLLFVRDPDAFTTRTPGVSVPPLLEDFAPEDTEQVSYVVEYHDGGAKIYLQSGASRSDAERLARRLSVAKEYRRA